MLPSSTLDLEYTSAQLLPPGETAPTWLVLGIAVLVTPTVFVGFSILNSVWLTYLSLYYLWIVSPALVCFCWTGSRRIVGFGLKRALRRPWVQTAIAVGVIPVIIAASLFVYHSLRESLGIDKEELRPELGIFGLTPAAIFGDVGVLAWLTFINPMMEELFWRIFLFESLRRPDGASSVQRWWGAAIVTNMIFASYHVPVALNFFQPALVAVAYVGLVGLGLALQIIVEHVGVIVAIGVHLAVDACASLIVADMLWRWGLRRI